jgi:hypothetical protein
MFNRKVFSRTVFCAIAFATLFFAPSFADTVEEAKEDYLEKVDSLIAKSGDYVDESVLSEYKERAESIASSESGGATGAAPGAGAGGENPPDNVASVSENQDTDVRDEIADLQKKADDAKAKEQSTANKLLGGLSIAATGIGGMQLMQGLAEKNADEAASSDMSAYLATIKCGIGGIRNVAYNGVGAAPPETRELADARMKYTLIARKTKTAKESLGMAPGIESDLIISIDALYDNSGTDTDGIFHHFDTATERADSGAGQKRAVIGGVVAGAGIIGGVVGNGFINGGWGDKLKSMFGGKSDKLGDLLKGNEAFGGLSGEEQEGLVNFLKNNNIDVGKLSAADLTRISKAYGNGGGDGAATNALGNTTG